MLQPEYAPYVMPGSTGAGSSIPGGLNFPGGSSTDPRESFVPVPPSPVQAPPPRYEQSRVNPELVGPRTIDQLSKDYADFIRNARRVESELRQTKTNLDACSVEKTAARSEASTCAVGYEDATQRGIAIERRAQECLQQMEQCRQLKRDNDLVLAENEYLKGEIQRLLEGKSRSGFVPRPQAPPARISAAPAEYSDVRPPPASQPPKRRRPAPPPESPVCVIL